jgi:hypothetical protein
MLIFWLKVEGCIISFVYFYLTDDRGEKRLDRAVGSSKVSLNTRYAITIGIT